MGFDCGSWCAKYILCLFNFAFFILGSIVLGVGIWLAADKASFVALLKMVENEHLEQFTQPAVIEQMAYILIVCGAVMFFLSFLGYCGAIRESQCLLTTYGVCMISILILQVAACGLAVAYKDQARTETKNFLQSTITRYYSSTDRPDAVTLMWNQMMSQLSCCGVDDHNDFSLSDSWLKNRQNRTIPEACCILDDKMLMIPKDQNCTVTPNEENSYSKKGCYDAFVDWIMLHRNIVLGCCIGVGLVQLFAIFLAFCLCRAIDKYRGIRL